MDVLIGFAVAALKAGVSGVVENEFVQALANQGINIGSDKFRKYLENRSKELSEILTDKNLQEMKVPADKTAYVRAEITELLQNVEESLFCECKYDATSLAEALYGKYTRQKAYAPEDGDEIRKILSVLSEKAVSLEKERDGFIQDSLINIMKSQDDMRDDIRELIQNKDEKKENRKAQKKKRIPDRTEEYYKKWKNNMFLNDFDEDDAEAGVNIPLRELYKTPLYRLRNQKTDLSNLEERLDKCVQGQDIKNRMLLILGQPGMGKSTMITWFIHRYQEKQDVDKKEILVYRFTDLNIDGSFNSIGGEKREKRIDSVILKCLNMEEQDLDGKILILDGFDEVAVGNNRTEILNSLYNSWALDTSIKNFSLVVTCRENYIENLSRLKFTYIILQPWNEVQIAKFCEKYGRLARLQIPDESVNKMKDMREVFGIPLILYMTLALEIAIKREYSAVEVYDQIFSLDGGIYDRCLKNDASLRWDDEHWISELKRQIHQFSREISMWMFENNPDEAAIPKKEYEKIQDKIFEEDNEADKSKKKDVLIGNYFKIYDGAGTEQLTFVHRSIYQYFVAETIYSEGRDAVIEMTEKSQKKLAGVLGYRLKKGRIDYTIGQYLKTKVSTLIATYSEEKKKQFYIWLEGTAVKMLETGMLYYTGENIKAFRNVIEKELKCFLNLLDILRLFFEFSHKNLILQDANSRQMTLYVRNLICFEYMGTFRMLDLRGIDLRGVDLSGLDLRKTELSESDLRGANLRGAHLGNAAKINLRGTSLRGSKMIDADLSGADLREADLRDIQLSGVNLKGAHLEKADLRGAYLEKVDLRGAHLEKADLDRSHWMQEDVGNYIDLIKQAEFDAIFSRSEITEERRLISRRELLTWYPD